MADSKEAKYAWTAVNQGWASDAVLSMFDTGLGYLIDMEMYGRDLKLDGDVSLGDNGYLEDADWPSDIDGRYSREEIAEEVEWLDDFDAKTGSPAAFDLASLVQPGERIADYTISGTGTNWGAPSYQCIVEEVPPISMPRLRTRCTGSSTRAPLLATPWTCCARPWAQCPQRPSAKTTA